ncbi:Uncharacterised protein [Afipia felis]|uniref:Uncharacterized protein n=2 Tax=Afipia felis TaxID=1035 RepID=A0A380WBN8_AFIFE|nr:hypothetical protein HMPREF9697_02160 [Afipia felis ATCC 53690]SUU78339.1 Uncharacterised protein [Afipia felis]SUU86404.1 Uncharacterised protein [Afipia felis]
MLGRAIDVSRNARPAEAFATIGLDGVTTSAQHIDYRFCFRNVEHLTRSTDDNLEWMIFLLAIDFRS